MEKGTWKFKIDDNERTIHDILIPNTLYTPKAPFHLLLPQRWNIKSADTNGTYCVLQHDKIQLKLNGPNMKRKLLRFYKVHQHALAKEMNSTVAKDIESNNLQKPEVTIDRDSEGYQPITPFDFKVDHSNNMKYEDDDKMKEGKLLLVII